MKYFSICLILLTGSVWPVRGEPEPFTLERLQQYALEHAPGLARQRLSFANQEAAVQIARAKFDPTFSARREWSDASEGERTSGSVQQTLPADLNLTGTVTLQEREDRGDVTTYALQLSKTLLGGGGFRESMLQLDSARIQEAREWNRLSLEQRRLMLTVARQYFEVVRSQQTLRLRQLQLERARVNLEHALVREDPLDIATARLRIPESELDVIVAERAIFTGILSLKNEIGFPLSGELVLAGAPPFELREPEEETDILRALEEHELLLNARLDQELARKEWQVARSRRFPEVSARLSVQNRDEGDGDDSETETRGEIAVSWSWMDRRERAELRQKLNNLENVRIALEQAETERRREISTLASRVREAAQTVSLQEQRVQVLEQQLVLFQDRWENGEIGILEYVRSQNSLEDARVQALTQQLRYLELLAEYDFAVGR